MKFTETKLKGAYIIETEPIRDERGFFARSWCKREFEKYGIDFTIVQCNVSYNEKKGTVRGMHYQVSPHQEMKLVSCIRGTIYDVIVDLRPDSPTYKKWDVAKLSADNYRMLYIPEGLAHGFQTLEDGTVVLYHMSEFYHPECARGLKWNDPALDIRWSLPSSVISDRDLSHPDFEKLKV